MEVRVKTYPILRHCALALALGLLNACGGGAGVKPSAELPGAETASVARPQLDRARARLADRQAQAALSELAQISQPERLSARERAEYLDLHAQALDLAGDWLGSARERVSLSHVAGTGDAARQNQDRLWRTLRRQRAETLSAARASESDNELGAWLELASITATFAIDPARLKQEVDNWLAQYPAHPAARDLPAELAAPSGETIAAYAPRQIALLLPLSGQLAPSATLIRDGFLTAYYQQHGAAMPAIRIYDTGSQDPVQAYQQAVADGADFVVGPLEKEAVTRLSAAAGLPVPTLSLNRSDKPGPAKTHFYQFGLIPEDEAMRLAERASGDGRHAALALMPRTLLGERLGAALKTQFEAAGGQVLNTVYFDRGQLMEGAVKEALGLGASQARYDAIRAIVGGKLAFEPRRRGDVDSVFLSASPDEARQLKPLLDFYNAQALPVYASNRVYAGDATADRDLEGIAFPDQPWIIGHSPELNQLRQTVKSLWPAALDKRVARLFALGFDAYLVIPQLHQLRNVPGYRLAGLTGELALTNSGWVVQHQPWARIVGGVAQAWPAQP